MTRPFYICICLTHLLLENVAKLHDKIEALVGEKKWEEVAAAAIHLKYLDNIETAAKAKEDELSS